jgi:hypothetical protein
MKIAQGRGPHELGVHGERLLLAGVKGQAFVRGVEGETLGRRFTHVFSVPKGRRRHFLCKEQLRSACLTPTPSPASPASPPKASARRPGP